MERDAVISHGVSSFAFERLCLSSDALKCVFCRNCGTIATPSYITDYESFRCRRCNEKDLGRNVIPYAYKLFLDMSTAMGFDIRFSGRKEKSIDDKLIEDDEVEDEEEAVDEPDYID